MPVIRSAAKRSINDDIDGKGDYFDLLGLHNDTIHKVFSFLPIKDRMRARLNKRLSKIETKSKYYVKRAELKQISFYEHSMCVRIQNRWYPIELLERIAHNTSIGWLEIDFYPDGLIRQFCNLTKKFRNISTIHIRLNLQFLSRQMAEHVMMDTFFVDLTKICENLKLDYTSNISSKALHQMYTSMNDGSSNLHKITTYALNRKTLGAFLKLLGISYINGQVFSNRNIEVFKDSTNDVEDYYVNIFDGFFRIEFNVLHGGLDGLFKVQLYKNIAALDRAKNNPIDNEHRRIRMKVYSE